MREDQFASAVIDLLKQEAAKHGEEQALASDEVQTYLRDQIAQLRQLGYPKPVIAEAYCRKLRQTIRERQAEYTTH